MKRALIAAAEAVLLLSFIFLLPILRPDGELGTVRSQTPPAVPVFTQGTALWDAGLTLPDTSDRVVHYIMDVRLDTAKNLITGSERLVWRNTTGRPQTTFPFHLYHNAFKNNRSTYARESGWELRGDMTADDYGWTDIKRFGVVDGDSCIDILPTLKFVQPDDGNSNDETVCEVSIPDRLSGSTSVSFEIEFETKQPKPVSRTGVVREYHFVAQWFPKIGVWWNPSGTGGAWNCHQFHETSEFFADYGTYDVKITLPRRYTVGATGGISKSVTSNNDGTLTHRFYQEDVHDFAWVTAPELDVNVRTFSHRSAEPGERPDRHHGLRDVKVILLSQPHHAGMIDRYFTATFNALRYFGEWYGEYPYETITVVDPANSSNSGGMEYPTLITGGTNMYSPAENESPEGVTVHEFGHQFWYGLVGNNEFEEAWLDEGFNTYSTDRVIRTAWPPFKPVRYLFGGSGAGSYVGIPLVFRDVETYGLAADNSYIRSYGKRDVMAKRAWEYNQTYGLNSYTKPGMSLLMLERYVGEEMMYRIMRTYHHRYRFRHPTSADFIRTVLEVTGKDYQWLFDQTWYSSNLFDYAVDRITNQAIPPAAGKLELLKDSTDRESPRLEATYECDVVVRREGEAVAPVDVVVTFEDGKTVREEWDGMDRWKRFRYYTAIPVLSVTIDPEQKLVLDINRNNNTMFTRGRGSSSLAARFYGAQFMFWVQNYLEFTSYWH